MSDESSDMDILCGQCGGKESNNDDSDSSSSDDDGGSKAPPGSWIQKEHEDGTPYW